MRISESIQIGFVLGLAILAWLRPLAPERRLRIVLLACGACAAMLLARWALPLPASSYVRDWVPAALLLFPYWQTGQFFTAANHRLETALGRRDNVILKALARRGWEPGANASEGYFELAYLMCYPLVPLGLGVLYVAHRRAAADAYWMVVLVACDLCFLVTIFYPAMPPRSLPSPAAGRGAPNNVRRLNLEVLNRGSIQAITFPSAHVASTTACALVLLRFVPPVGAIFLILAMSIAAGAFLGRYHYFLDVVLGAAVALGVFCFFTYVL